MNFCKELSCENYETLKLIGSQVNLTPRLDKTTLVSDNRNSRPCSAAQYFRPKNEHKIKCIRPKSADHTNLNLSNCKTLQRTFNFNENKMFENSPLTVSHFTDSSSKLLQNLIENSKQRIPVGDDNSFSVTSFPLTPKEFKSEDEVMQNKPENKTDIFIVDLNDDSKVQKNFREDNMRENKYSNIKNSALHSEFSDVSDNKTVRFLESHQLELLYEKKFHGNQAKYTFCANNKNCCLGLQNEIKTIEQESHTCQTFNECSKETKVLETESLSKDTEDKNETDILKTFHSINECFEGEKESEEIFFEQWRNSPKWSKVIEKSVENQEKNSESPVSQPKVEAKNAETENKFQKALIKSPGSSDEEIDKGNEKPFEMVGKNENNDIHQKLDVSNSTYEEIVCLLQILDEEDSESLNSEIKEDAARTAINLGTANEKIDYFSAVSSYLEEIERDNNSVHENYSSAEKWGSTDFDSPRLDQLLNKNSVELAHEVFSLKIQIEDQKKGIKLLRNALAELKEERKVEKLEHQEALHKVNSEAEALVQRHQKFIKQLLNEKKNLNETISKLVEDVKMGEERYKKNIKAMEEKHSIEIKRAKEAQMVAEKIKREKWMENKTQKIKEMTIKGLEPELSRMAAHQQEEITELRKLHKAELEALELRAARRNSELMDELRAELTKEKERAIAKETATLRAAMANDFEIEKSALQHCCQNLKERIIKLEEQLSNQELEFQQRLIDCKQEEEKKKQKMIRDHQENLEEVRRQHLVTNEYKSRRIFDENIQCQKIELRQLKESMEAEKESFLNNYKEQQATKSLEREAELHQQYKRERDKEIELVIETLEKESAKIQSEQNAANESKLKRLKDNMEAEIKEIEASEAALKIKLSEFKTKLSEKEDIIIELNSQIRQFQTELTFVKKTCEEMSLEKARLKEVIREEFENSLNNLVKEKENLEKEIINLKELHLKELTKKDQQNLQSKYEMQKELTRVYGRIKTAVNKKEKIIESLREENESINQKCCQLEIMLDQQRRNLLLQ